MRSARHPLPASTYWILAAAAVCSPSPCRLGATVTGADASEENIKTASIHAAEQNLDIDYQATTAAVLVDAGHSFDVILKMEVIEHVADPPAFID